ncbi:MAG: hypothetical protein M1162_00390 [Candidatus Thermoplasmatota archaeon]|nr:hypothetical protein [Candidatus Thermoplasmatota archaeon]
MITYVLDTSAVISGKINILEPGYIIPSAVVEEISRGSLKRILDGISGTLKIQSPSENFVERVIEKSRKTGDYGKLSTTDVEVVALALERGSAVISDDFAVQNVCEALGLDHLSTDLQPIDSAVTWMGRCQGCGKTYRKTTGTCSVCGHAIRRIRQRSRKIRK